MRKKDDLSYFEPGMILGSVQVGLNISDSRATIFKVYIKSSNKEKI